MAATHDYSTVSVWPADLDSTMILVGESGGLSAIYDVEPSAVMPDCWVVYTEHGSLYLESELSVEVLDVE